MPTSGTETKISVRVHPNAAANELMDFSNRILQVKVAAPLVKGKANRELVAFLSQLLDIAKSKIRIIKGHYTRNKVITIDSISHQEIIRRLSTYSKH